MYETTKTICTPDGKRHTLLGSVTLAAIVREYAGEEAAAMVEALEDDADETQARVDSDLDSYESSLDYWRSQAQDWKDFIDQTLRLAEGKRNAKKILTDALDNLSRRINQEL